jgi:ABC-type multidrug transport system fused ATPase/permease subunit
MGGWFSFTILNLIMITFTICKIYSDYLIGEWTDSFNQLSQFAFYSSLIFAFAIITTIMAFCRLLYGSTISLRASKLIHEEMISKVMNAPINLYFDVTPIGRILNKFSKDLAVVDYAQVFNVT